MSANDIITGSFGGKTFRGSRRTFAHLEATQQALGCRGRLVVIQGCFHTGVAASAGTHDKDAVLDVYIPGWDWWAAQRFLRERGWAAWYRYPPTFGRHIHMVSLGYTTPVGIYVPGQVSDYYGHRNGLAGHAPDLTWHPPNIAATVFDYGRWTARKESEDDMTPDQDKRLKKVEADLTKLLKAQAAMGKRIETLFKEAKK